MRSERDETLPPGCREGPGPVEEQPTMRSTTTVPSPRPIRRRDRFIVYTDYRRIIESPGETPLPLARRRSMPDMRPPNYQDADLVLRLFDLRREAKLREARSWIGGFY